MGYISTGLTSTMKWVGLSQTILTWLMLTEMRGFLFYSMNHGQSRGQETGNLGRSVYEDSFSETAVPTSVNPPLRAGGLPAPAAGLSIPTSNPDHRNAKGFWNHFLFRRRSRFQSILPIQNNEVHALQCRAIPFSQKVAHDGCEPQLLKNNVCFGKCDTLLADDSACLLCSPAELIMKEVRLQCKDSTEVIKDIKIVEDCQCKADPGRNINNRGGPALIDPSVGN